MSLPRATYRLQFRQGMGFDEAAQLAPYFGRLGVSHLYASPLFQAAPGSTHGYDVTDHGRLDDSLGGMDGFLRLSAALKAEGLGLIVDIVPNHMAASAHNPWWRDVLRHGRDSGFRGHFDIDWSAPRLILPLLGQSFGAALQAGEFALGIEAGELVWRYHETALPLAPASWQLVLEAAGFGMPLPADADLVAWLAGQRADTTTAGRLSERLAALSGQPDLLAAIHERQHWRLAYWRCARDMLTYRRFFEISDLVGVRVEDQQVFDDVHRLLFDLLAAGHVDGVRVDHVDGLADPAGYLRRLKDQAPTHPPIWVEKILIGDERLPADWPTEGTTGYEFANAVGGLLTDPSGASQLRTIYDAFVGGAEVPRTMLADAKCELLTYNLAAELSYLTTLAVAVAATDLVARDWGPDSLRRALIAVAIAMPVYRTYLGPDGPSPSDADLLQRVEQRAKVEVDHEDPAVIGDLLRVISGAQGPEADRLRSRLEQVTGALMAKAMEDTLFYRFPRLLSANEVGGEPQTMSLAAPAFDREMAVRAELQPFGISATATHDTKRGEDARMRIAAICDRPAGWEQAVHEWDRLIESDGLPAPDAEMRWQFYQALLGAWEPGDLTERIGSYLVKAAREAKQVTRWTSPAEGYEGMLTAFVSRVLSPRHPFADAFARAAAPFIAAGERKSLVQLALKLTLPGIPDIYQGSEAADLSLVDPDNRRQVDFDVRQAALDQLIGPDAPFDATKTALLRWLLAARRVNPDLFGRGDYRRLESAPAPDQRLFGFAREHAGHVVVVLSELWAPPDARDAPPQFALPHGWETLRLEACHPPDGLARNEDLLAPRDGFAGLPVSVAVGRL